MSVLKKRVQFYNLHCWSPVFFGFMEVESVRVPLYLSFCVWFVTVLALRWGCCTPAVEPWFPGVPYHVVGYCGGPWQLHINVSTRRPICECMAQINNVWTHIMYTPKILKVIALESISVYIGEYQSLECWWLFQLHNDACCFRLMYAVPVPVSKSIWWAPSNVKSIGAQSYYV